jgi:hypothetical protein
MMRLALTQTLTTTEAAQPVIINALKAEMRKTMARAIDKYSTQRSRKRSLIVLTERDESISDEGPTLHIITMTVDIK